MSKEKTSDMAAELEELRDRLADEIRKNREKDLVMLHQSRLAAMGEMLSHIAHQWRQPLNELACMIQTLKLDQSGKKIADLKEFTSESMGLIMYMSQTIDDFRNFFKPSRSAEVFDVSAAIEKAVSLVHTSLKGSGIELAYTQNTDCRAFGHSNEISQVLLNIINNARDELLARKVEAPLITISSSCDAQSITVRIKDNAGGIPEGLLEKIFDPYFTTKQKNQGTGLGLYISRMIVQDNGKGTLEAFNIEDGAEFVIKLPGCREGA